MNNLLAARFADSPVMVAPGHEGWMSNCLTALQSRLDAVAPDQMAEFAKADDEEWWGREGSFKSMLRPYNVEDGVLQVPVKGMLMHGFPFAAFGMATGYEYIVKAFERGMADDNVREIAMVVDSGGGEVAGNFDAVDKLYRMRGTKPFTALVNEHAYSAAFSLASAMDKIVLPRTGGVGSVGVVTAHIDQSKRLEDAGLKVTFVHAGAHKVDGNPYEPLSEDAKNRMQARIDGLYNIFVGTVARNLGVSEKTVRDTEALTYSADDAIGIGFAHEIRAFDEALAALGGRPAATGVTTMSHEKPTEGAGTFVQADLDAARAEGMSAGAQAERERIQGITSHAAAADRSALAFHLSMNTDLTVEAAASILEASPVEAKAPEAAAPQGASPFEQAMQHGNPEMGGEGGEGNSPEATTSESILADYRLATGQAKH